MTPDEAKRVLENAKRDLPNWEVVLNVTYSDETVREGVLFNLLKMFYRATGNDDEVFRLQDESFEGAIGRYVLDATGSYYPSHPEIEEVVGTALAHHRRWTSSLP